jgi:hypothetical protein
MKANLNPNKQIGYIICLKSEFGRKSKIKFYSRGHKPLNVLPQTINNFCKLSPFYFPRKN